ncbi:MAG: polyphenol oxidase family protein [Acidimicrobiia bacterium]|nr:polyphenol oxidase family protein [Acidimicrobiia bacterium]
MITTPAYAGAAFGTVGDGDLTEPGTRATAADHLGIAGEWAWMHQVHGGAVLQVSRPGPAGDADALLTEQEGLPLAVRTADCVPVVIHADTAVAVVHAGWRGLAAGVVANALEALSEHHPRRAAVGPSIGPCCYEVGPEVIERVGAPATTTWGTTSADLWTAAERQLPGVEVWRADLCTHCETTFHSYRATATELRQTTVAWR